MRKLIFLLVVGIFSISFAEDAYIDSLKKAVENSRGEEKISLLNELGKAHWGISSAKTLEYSQKALQISQQINDLKGEAQSYNNIGVAYYYQDDYETALEYFLKSYEIRKELGNKKDIVASLNNIGIIYDDLSKFEQALEYYLESLRIYEEIDDKIGIATSLHNIGVVYENLSNYNKALEYLLRAHLIYEELGDKKGIASSLGNIGIIYKDLSNYDKAIEYHLESLKISSEIDDKIGVARALDNIGIIYDNIGNYDKAIEYYHRSLEIEEDIGDNSGLAGSYNNIGIIYDDLKKYEKALEYYYKSLEIYQEIGDKNGIANSFNNIGVVYENIEQYDNSLEQHFNAKEIFIEIGHKKGLAASYNNIGSVYLKMGNYREAKKYFNKSLNIAQEIAIKDLIIEIYEKLSNLFLDQENFEQALTYYKLYTAVKDSIFNKEKIEKIAGMQTTYEVEQLIQQQDREIELLQKDNEIYRLKVEKHELIRWRLYLGFFLVIVLVSVIFYLYRLKNKANIQLENLVESRTKDLQKSNEQLTKEINERKKVEQQLIRSERLAGIGELAAGIAHEIRNPLGNISSSAQYCLGKVKLDTKIKKYLEIIREDSEKANQIIKGLLDFANPRELKLTQESLVDLLTGILDSVKARCKKNKVKIVKNFPAEIPEISIDKKWMERAFLNLILNGIQAMSDGGTLKVSLDYDKENEQIIVLIQDKGGGISKKDLKKIFDPFFTTREDGVGLGLSLAHQIIEDHQGEMHIESKVNEGTEIKIVFSKTVLTA